MTNDSAVEQTSVRIFHFSNVEEEFTTQVVCCMVQVQVLDLFGESEKTLSMAKPFHLNRIHPKAVT